MAPKRQGRTVACHSCGKPIYKQAGELKRAANHFCSNACVGISNKGNKYNPGKPLGKVIKCSICGKEVYRALWELKRASRYCSYKCLATSKKRGKDVPCAICGKLSYVHRYRLGNAKKHYCSKHAMCAAAHSITKPERQLISLIDKYNLPYRYTGQGDFWIERVNPDFVNINGEKKAIAVQGCYWHNCPACFPKGGNIKDIVSEARRTQVYKKYGWSVIYLWEHTFKDKNWEKLIMEKL